MGKVGEKMKRVHFRRMRKEICFVSQKHCNLLGLGSFTKKSICKSKSELLSPQALTFLFFADEQIVQGWACQV